MVIRPYNGGSSLFVPAGAHEPAETWGLRTDSAGRDLDLDAGAFAGPGVDGEVGAD